MREEKLRAALKTEAQKAQVDEAAFYAVMSKINRKEEKSKMNFKKIIPIALCATIVLGAAAVAATQIFVSVTTTTAAKVFDSFPSADEVKKAVGFDAVFKESLGDYTFESALLTDSENKDESGNTLESTKGIAFTYAKGDSKLLLSAVRGDAAMSGEAIECGGVTLYYNDATATSGQEIEVSDENGTTSWTFSDSVEPSEGITTTVGAGGASETTVGIKDGENGKFSVDVTYSVKTLTWQKDTIAYTLTDINGALDKEQLIKAAQELV